MTKKVTATFTMTIDLTDSIEEAEQDGVEISDLQDFAISCMQEDLQQIVDFKTDVKFHTHVEIQNLGDYTKCDVCEETITWEEYGRNTGLCMECVEAIQ